VLQRTCCASFGYYPMSTTDSISATGADRFWSELRQLIAQAASMAPDAAVRVQSRRSWDDRNDLWPPCRLGAPQRIFLRRPSVDADRSRAARQPAKIMRQFLSDSHDCWPQIRGDMETNANLRALHERAFEIRDAPTAEACRNHHNPPRHRLPRSPHPTRRSLAAGLAA
jgi:hypothetical protein